MASDALAEARIAILPRSAASRVITSAIARAGWIVSLAIIIITIPVLLDVIDDRGLEGAVWVPLAALVVQVGLLLAGGRWPCALTNVLFLVVGGAAALAYSVALLGADPTLNGDASFVLNRPAMVLVLVGFSVSRPIAGVLWSLAGFVVASAVGVLASAVAGVGFAPGWGPLLSFVVYAGAFAAVAAIGAGQGHKALDLGRLEADTRRLAIESQFEQRAAAIVHDTVLGDLTTVMATSGRLDDRVAQRFRSDVASLANASWLRESRDSVEFTRSDAVLRNSLEALVSDFQWRGLGVDITGDSATVIHVSAEATASLVAAVRACLDNVLTHAGVAKAELVVSTSATAATVMVIDDGVGFDTGAVADDRLGLRSAVVNRIESHGGSVRVWSGPGEGTSVLLSVPTSAIEKRGLPGE